MLTSTQASSVQLVKTLEVTEVQQDSISYFSQVLNAALLASEPEFGPYKIEHVQISHSQERALKLLDQGQILDVLHSVSSLAREQDFIAIKYPLLNGLMGMRLALINQHRKQEFDQASIQQIKQKLACQGRDWPDSDILEFNGFKVSRVLIFESMFQMVSKSRCDYFPRGIHEVFSEYKRKIDEHPNLMIYKGLLLKYHAPVYFFVSKSNTELAKRLESGLSIISQNGELQRLFEQADFIQAVLPLSKWDNLRTVSLINPDYPKNTINGH
ncbi:hypothetical protein [Paraglaciecola aestuariivivens]